MWVIVTLVILAALFIFALSLPLEIALHMDVAGKPKFHLRLSWFFGLVDREITGRKQHPEEKKKAEIRQKPGKRRWNTRDILEILKARGLAGQFYGFLKSFLSNLRIRNLVADLRIGLDNPADTGFLFAIIGPVLALINAYYPHQIRIQPSFEEATLEGYSYGRIRLRPIRMVIPLLKFAFSPAAIRTVKIVVIRKWKRKK